MELQGTVKRIGAIQTFASGFENEIWKPVKGYEDIYRVSNLGRVKSVDHYCAGRLGSGKQNGRILKMQKCYKGYLRVSLSRNKIRFNTGSHRLVAIAFLENPNNYPQINHKNGIKDDNRLENLEWCTNTQNQLHAVENGLINPNYGEDHHNSKISNNAVLEIRKRISNGEIQKNIAKEYNISAAAICQINSNKTYKNL